MTVQEIFELRRQGRVEEAYDGGFGPVTAEFDKRADVGAADVTAVSEVRHIAISNIASRVSIANVNFRITA